MSDGMKAVKMAANALNCSDVSAATTLANKAGGGMAAICFLAAVVEMTEPSNAISEPTDGLGSTSLRIKDEGMELKKLAGEHLLDAVDFSNEQVKTWGDHYEDCQVMRFRLDGNVYVAAEDPDDGYRSHMNDLTIAEAATMKNTFAPVRVIGRHREKGSFGDVDDVLELIDAGTGKVVIEVGTVNTNDYYPCFVAAFHPENMTPNAKVSGAGTAGDGMTG